MKRSKRRVAVALGAVIVGITDFIQAFISLSRGDIGFGAFAAGLLLGSLFFAAAFYVWTNNRLRW